MEERISGFREEGTWENVVAHGDRISKSLRELGTKAHPRMEHDTYREAVREWEQWRPRKAETLEGDVRPRTAEQASVVEGEGERRGQPAGSDLGRAGTALVAPAEHAHVDESMVERIAEAARLAARALDTGMRATVRYVEENIYHHLMTRVAPCYFDNRVVSANLERCSMDEEAYRFEININNDELKSKVSDRLNDLEPVNRFPDPDAR